jgi:hypothetical protein
MGENFAEVWHSDRCPPTLKKVIFRTALEEIIVRTDAKKETLHFTIHWKGGVHTQLPAFSANNARLHVDEKGRQPHAGAREPGDAKGQTGY